MSKILMDYKISYYGNDIYTRQLYKEKKKFKKEINFDIINFLPPVPFPLPSPNGMKREEMEGMLCDENIFRKHIIPFSHPLEFLIWTSPNDIKNFSSQLFLLPHIYYDICNKGTEESVTCYNLSWGIFQEVKNSKSGEKYRRIWDVKKYMRLWNYISKNILSPSAFEFLFYTLILNDILDEKEYEEFYEILLPEFKENHLMVKFSSKFKKNDFDFFQKFLPNLKKEKKIIEGKYETIHIWKISYI